MEEQLSQLALAEKIAREAHAGQFRRDGVTPYIAHVEAVVARCSTEEEKAIAWLHDVVEDCAIDFNDLRDLGVYASIRYAVNALSNFGESYEEFIENINAEGDHIRNVKIADLLANLSDQPSKKQIRKYAEALLTLTE